MCVGGGRLECLLIGYEEKKVKTILALGMKVGIYSLEGMNASQ